MEVALDIKYTELAMDIEVSHRSINDLRAFDTSSRFPASTHKMTDQAGASPSAIHPPNIDAPSVDPSTHYLVYHATLKILGGQLRHAIYVETDTSTARNWLDVSCDR
jgi:hypothetical protein